MLSHFFIIASIGFFVEACQSSVGMVEHTPSFRRSSFAVPVSVSPIDRTTHDGHPQEVLPGKMRQSLVSIEDPSFRLSSSSAISSSLSSASSRSPSSPGGFESWERVRQNLAKCYGSSTGKFLISFWLVSVVVIVLLISLHRAAAAGILSLVLFGITAGIVRSSCIIAGQ